MPKTRIEDVDIDSFELDLRSDDTNLGRGIVVGYNTLPFSLAGTVDVYVDSTRIFTGVVNLIRETKSGKEAKEFEIELVGIENQLKWQYLNFDFQRSRQDDWIEYILGSEYIIQNPPVYYGDFSETVGFEQVSPQKRYDILKRFCEDYDITFYFRTDGTPVFYKGSIGVSGTTLDVITDIDYTEDVSVVTNKINLSAPYYAYAGKDYCEEDTYFPNFSGTLFLKHRQLVEGRLYTLWESVPSTLGLTSVITPVSGNQVLASTIIEEEVTAEFSTYYLFIRYLVTNLNYEEFTHYFNNVKFLQNFTKAGQPKTVPVNIIIHLLDADNWNVDREQYLRDPNVTRDNPMHEMRIPSSLAHDYWNHISLSKGSFKGSIDGYIVGTELEISWRLPYNFQGTMEVYLDGLCLTKSYKTTLEDSSSVLKYGERYAEPDILKVVASITEIEDYGLRQLNPAPELSFRRVRVPNTDVTRGYVYDFKLDSLEEDWIVREIRHVIEDNSWFLELSCSKSTVERPSKTRRDVFSDIFFRLREKEEVAFPTFPYPRRIVLDEINATDIVANFVSIREAEEIESITADRIFIGEIGSLSTLISDVCQIGVIERADEINADYVTISQVGSIGILHANEADVNQLEVANRVDTSYLFVTTAGSINDVYADIIDADRIENVNQINNIGQIFNVTAIGTIGTINTVSMMNVDRINYLGEISQLGILNVDTISTVGEISSIGIMSVDRVSSIGTISTVELMNVGVIQNLGRIDNVGLINVDDLDVSAVGNVRELYVLDRASISLQTVNVAYIMQGTIVSGDFDAVTINTSTINMAWIGYSTIDNVLIRAGNINNVFFSDCEADTLILEAATITNLFVETDLSGGFQIQSQNIGDLQIQFNHLDLGIANYLGAPIWEAEDLTIGTGASIVADTSASQGFLVQTTIACTLITGPSKTLFPGVYHAHFRVRGTCYPVDTPQFELQIYDVTTDEVLGRVQFNAMDVYCKISYWMDFTVLATISTYSSVDVRVINFINKKFEVDYVKLCPAGVFAEFPLYFKIDTEHIKEAAITTDLIQEAAIKADKIDKLQINFDHFRPDIAQHIGAPVWQAESLTVDANASIVTDITASDGQCVETTVPCTLITGPSEVLYPGKYHVDFRVRGEPIGGAEQFMLQVYDVTNNQEIKSCTIMGEDVINIFPNWEVFTILADVPSNASIDTRVINYRNGTLAVDYIKMVPQGIFAEYPIFFNIQTDWIEDFAITGAKIATLTIDTDHIINGAINADKIQEAAITSEKIDELAIHAEHIDQFQICTDHLTFGLKNLIANGDFEAGNLLDWVGEGAISTETVYGGTCSLLIAALGTEKYMRSKNPIPVLPLERYKFRCYCRQAAGTAQLQVIWSDLDDNPISTVTLDSFTGELGWIKLEGTGTVPTDAYYGRVQVKSINGNGYWDNIYCRKQIFTDDIEDAAVIADKIAAGAVVTKHIRFDSLTSDPTYESGKMWWRSDLDQLRFSSATDLAGVAIIPKYPLYRRESPAENLVANGDFEIDRDQDNVPDYWWTEIQAGSPLFERSTAYAIKGGYTFVIKCDVGDHGRLRSDRIQVQPETKYYLKVWTASGAAAASGSMGLHVHWFAKDGSYIVTTWTDKLYPIDPPVSEWKCLADVLTSPAEACYAEVCLIHDNTTGTNTKWVYFDAVYMSELRAAVSTEFDTSEYGSSDLTYVKVPANQIVQFEHTIPTRNYDRWINFAAYTKIDPLEPDAIFYCYLEGYLKDITSGISWNGVRIPLSNWVRKDEFMYIIGSGYIPANHNSKIVWVCESFDDADTWLYVQLNYRAMKTQHFHR